MNQQVAVFSHLRRYKIPGPHVSCGLFDRQSDAVGIRSWGDEKIVFDLALIPVVSQVYPRIYRFILHFGIIGNIRDPLPGIASDVVMTLRD